MSGDELDEYFKYVKYIASNAEISEWNNLKTETGKQQFLKKFWNNKNKEYGSENFQSEYFRRIETANQRYSTFQKKGWKTDRGRVYLKYGEPDEIERNPAQSDTRPYQIWHYYSIEGGVIFIFAELEGFGEYTLIHSTKRGELYDDKWQRKINTE
jgi:GWxTD domain-containing protein